MEYYKKNQHGFIPGRSTVTNLLCAVNDWTKTTDEGQPTDIIYIDFEKAFDRVPHNRLIAVLEHCGIRGKLLTWISDFLHDRWYRVKYGSLLSQSYSVESGVPQGSVLGPYLFNIYVAHLSKTITSPCSLYADDTKLYNNPLLCSGSIQSDLDNIMLWSNSWLLTLNKEKCTVVHLGRSNPKVQYYLDGVQMKTVSSQMDLGITISDNLKWELHITNVIKKANSILYLMRKAFSNITPVLLRKIFVTYVRPILEYGFQVWSPYYSKDIEALERVQRRATKIPRELRCMDYPDRLRFLNLTTLKTRRER